MSRRSVNPRDPDASSPRQSRSRLVLGLVVLVGVIGVSVLVLDRLSFVGRPGLGIGWLAVLTVSFIVAEACAVHLDLGENAHTFTLAEIPIVVGLFCFAPWQLLVARVVGGLAIMGWRFRRAPTTKIVFNAALFATEVGLYLLIFHLISAIGAGEVWPWLGVLLAGQVMNLVGATAVSAAIALSNGEPDPLGRVVMLGAVSSTATLSLGLLSIEIADRDAAALWMVAVVAVVLVAAYRQFGLLQRRYTSLRQVQEFTRVLAGSPELSTTISVALDQATTVLQAQRAELCLVGLTGSWNNIRIVHDLSGQRTEYVEGLGEEDALVKHLRERPRPFFVTSAQGHDTEVQLLRASRQAKDLVASPLVSSGNLVGTFAVFDHLGDVSTFTEDDLRVFETVANHVIISLEKARLIDELRVEVAEKRHQALHDPLTGLGNRAMFGQNASSALRANLAAGRQAAVLVMDLNRFKDINDTLGHQTGDILLRQLAERMRDMLPPGASAARLGGDEFVFVLPSISDSSDATRVADGLLSSLSEPFSIGGLELGVGAAIGIAIAPQHGEEPGLLLQHADIAMYASKEANNGKSVTFSSELANPTKWRLSLRAELKTALERGQLEVHYQPVAEISTGNVVGAEALLRWNHPEHGWIPPEDVVLLAEHLGLIRPLTMWVLETAIAQCSKWRADGLDVQVAVNLAAQSLIDETLARDTSRLLDAAGLEASHLVLEITETQVIRDPQQAFRVLTQLDELGLTLAVDDFGTGFSSLSYLTRLPVGEIKIDKSFVLQMLSDHTSHKVVQSVIDLGASLGKAIVAEGVEDLRTWDALASLGCGFAQGYYLSRPLAPRALEDWLSRRARRIPEQSLATVAQIR